MKSKNMETDKQFIFEKILLIFLILDPINQALKHIISYKVHFIFPMIYLLYIIYHKKSLKNIKEFIFIFMFFFLSTCYSVIRYQNYLYNFFGLMYILFVSALPWLLVGLNINNTKKILSKISNYTPLILLSNLLLIYICYILKKSLVGNMEISYSILPITIFSLYYFFEEKKIIKLFEFLLGLFIIVCFGSRGPLLCILVFILLYLLINYKEHILLILAIIILFFLVIFNYNSILNNSIRILSRHGIQSRTLYKIKTFNINDDTGRSKIRDVVYKTIDNNKFFGIGLGAERIEINREIYNMQKDMSSCYPHNIFLEFIVQYGLFLGSAMCVFVIYILIKSFSKLKNKKRDFMMIVMSLEFVRLMVSSSYINSVWFFFLLGLCINYLKEYKYEKSINNCTR